jgi:hypothetical protein
MKVSRGTNKSGLSPSSNNNKKAIINQRIHDLKQMNIHRRFWKGLQIKVAISRLLNPLVSHMFPPTTRIWYSWTHHHKFLNHFNAQSVETKSCHDYIVTGTIRFTIFHYRTGVNKGLRAIRIQFQSCYPKSSIFNNLRAQKQFTAQVQKVTKFVEEIIEVLAQLELLAA